MRSFDGMDIDFGNPNNDAKKAISNSKHIIFYGFSLLIVIFYDLFAEFMAKDYLQYYQYIFETFKFFDWIQR